MTFRVSNSWSRLAVVAAIVSAAGCSDSGGSKSPLADIDDGAESGQKTSALVTADKAVTLKLDTGARLTVPEGAVSKSVEIEMKRPADAEALPLVKNVTAQYKVASAPYVVTPHGTTFNKDLQLELPIAKGRTDKLVVAHLDDEKDTTWEIAGVPEISAGIAKVNVRHFSVYVLLERTESTSDVPSSGTVKERVLAKLKSCGLVKRDGKLADNFDVRTEEDVCEADCVLKAPCSDFEQIFCADSDTTTIESCFESCGGYGRVECATDYDGVTKVDACDGYEDCIDGSDEKNCPASAFLSCTGHNQEERVPVSNKCDGYEDCIDGSDESGCSADLYFTCKDGERVAADSRCDRYEDCDDGSDEVGCKFFQCGDGDQVDEDSVCDLYADCADGSDEAQGCLTLTCELGAGSISDSSSALMSLPKSRKHDKRRKH